MAVEITVPQMGESITEAVVGKWYKNAGDPIAPDEMLVSLETDKVTIDVPAPAGGTLAKITHGEGDTVRVGEVLGTLSNGAAAAKAPSAQPPSVHPERSAEREVEGSAGPSTRAEPSETAHGISATPVAKKLMAERNLDASQIKGTGPGGRILKEDVLGHTAVQPDRRAEGPESKAEPAPAPTQLRSVPQPPPAPKAPRAITEREERVRMTPLRRRVAERLLAAQSNAAILTTFNEVDMSGVIALRKRYAEPFSKRHGVKLGFMGFFVRASIAALQAYPQVNAEIDGEDVIFKHYHDIGVAVSGSRGLVVPVLRDADTLSMAELEKGIADYAQRARSDKLTLAELQGGTFTITNGGVFGSMLSTPILNPPQSAILGMHNIVERPVARDGQVVIRPVMYLALSYDHRLVDGREAVQFLVRIKECIEDPERLLLEV